MYDNVVTRNQFGANNTRDTETFSDQYVEDRTKIHEYNNDFDEYNTGNYTISVNAAGTALAIAGDGGIVQLSTVGVVANNFVSLQNIRADYQTQLGFRMWSAFLFSVDSALANILVGLLNTTATPFTPASETDGIWLSSAGTTALQINLAVGGVITTVPNAAVLVPGLANFVNFKSYWDGGVYNTAPAGRVVWELSGAGVVAPARGVIAAPVNFPGATLLNPTVAVANSSAAARQMNLDLFSVIKERVRINATPAF